MELLTPQDSNLSLIKGHASIEVNAFIHKKIENSAILYGEHIAVCAGKNSITYHQINQETNQLAHYLISLGVGSNVTVAFCLPRSIDAIVTIIAILKTGASYLPLNPVDPENRIIHILEDAKTPYLITLTSNCPHIPDRNIKVITLDTCRSVLTTFPNTNVETPINPHDPAYIIYTSGTTGKPKGVVIAHQSLSNYIGWCLKEYPILDGTGTPLFTPLSYDLCITSFFPALVTGKTVYILPETNDIHHLLEDFAKLPVLSFVKCTPSHLIVLKDLLSRKQNTKICHALIVGGEELTYEHLTPWIEHDPLLTIFNEYGPTEATVGCVVYKVSEFKAKKSVPIGVPINHTVIHILDEQMNLVPRNTPGEICISGPCLAKGYLFENQLTQNKFIDYFDEQDSAVRVYKTGDLGILDVNGILHYIRRIDRQIKLFGYRIDPIEIETSINQFADVINSVVFTHHINNDQFLAAAVCVNDNQNFSLTALNNYLGTKLPYYLRPTQILLMDKFPQGNNNKIDIEQLRHQICSKMNAETEGQHSLFEEIKIIWSSVLGVSEFTDDDNFFDLGGSSLHMLQVLARIKKLGWQISLEAFYKAPTITHLVNILANQIAHSNEPLPSLRAFSLIESSDSNRMSSDIEDAYPLSAMQMGMLLHHLTENELGIFHDIYSYEIYCEFHEDALHKAMENIISNNPILRTSFDLTHYSQPLQKVHKTAKPNITVIDLQHLTYQEQRALIERNIANDHKNKFDLNAPNPLKIIVYQLQEKLITICITFNHIILDGWSRVEIENSLIKGMFSANLDTSYLQEDSITKNDFRDFIANEISAINSKEMSDYWRKKYELFPITILNNFTEKEEMFSPDKLYSPIYFSIPAKIYDQINAIAKSLHLPIKHILQAAHCSVLSYLFNNDKIITGVVTNCRTENDEDLTSLGLFLNILPLAISTENKTWEAFIKDIYHAEIEMVPFRFTPLAHIQELNNHEILFDTAFNFTHFYKQNEIDSNLYKLNAKPIIINRTNYTLVAQFNLNTTGDNLNFWLDYNPDKISQKQVEKIGSYYLNALTAITKNIHQNINEAMLLTQDELQDISKLLCPPSIDKSTVIHSFVNIAKIRPLSLAISDGSLQLNFSQLDRYSNELARQLEKLTDQCDSKYVAIILPRSINWIVAILATLKAGLSFIPIELKQPHQQICDIIKDAEVACVITDFSIPQIELLSTKFSLPFINMNHAGDHVTENSFVIKTQPNDVCYMIYTSGSTGRPKGVLVENNSLHAYVTGIANTLNLSSLANLALLSPVNVDFSFTLLFLAITTGRPLYIIDDAIVEAPELFADFIQKMQIDCYKILPNLMETLWVVDKPQTLIPRECLIFGGQTPTLHLINKIRAINSNCKLINHYGPTETTIGALTHLITSELPSMTSHNVPIGTPINGVAALVMNKYKKPLPDGFMGELYLGGSTLAQGYYNNKDLTNQKFITFNTNFTDIRLYQTGDMVKKLQNGEFVFLGRNDFQIKIRGHRLEPFEVEYWIDKAPDIAQSVVIYDPKNEILVAHYVAKIGQKPNLDELKEHLQKHLPQHAIPALFIAHETLPTQQNGKIDRSALQRYSKVQEASTALKLPTTDIEKIVYDTWSEILKIPSFSVDDNFFELGGHSLTAIRIIFKLTQKISKTIKINLIFEAPTVEKLAYAIEKLTSDTPSILLDKAPVRDSYPVSFSQLRLWFLSQKNSNDNYNVYRCVKLTGAINHEALEQALNFLQQKHSQLRTAFFTDGKDLLQNILAPRLLKLSSIKIEDNDANEMISAFITRKFDLENGFLWRSQLFELSPDEHIFVICLHHIIADGWSLNIITSDLTSFYNQRHTDKFFHYTPIHNNLQYQDFAVWENRYWSTNQPNDSRIIFWKSYLNGFQYPSLPYTLKRYNEPAPSGFKTFEITGELFAKFKNLVIKSQTTSFVVLTALIGLILHKITGQSDLTLGFPNTNRDLPETEHIIGCFINTLLIRFDINPDSSFISLLQSIKKYLSIIHQNASIPFEIILDEIAALNNHMDKGLPSVLVFFQNHTPNNDLADLTMENVLIPISQSQNDLTFNFFEMDNTLFGQILFDSSKMSMDLINTINEFLIQLIEIVVEKTDCSNKSCLSMLEESYVLNYKSQDHAIVPSKHIDTLFKQVMNTHSEKIAMIDKQQPISYLVLNERINQIAEMLNPMLSHKDNKQPSKIIAIYHDRNYELVAGIFAALRLGYTCLLLDTALPTNRLNYILNDSKPDIILTSLKYEDTAISSFGVPLAYLEKATDQPTFISSVRESNTPAFLCYTSGSTGEPKGIYLMDDALINRIESINKLFPLEPTSKCAQRTPLSFVDCIAEILSPLLNGCTLVLMPVLQDMNQFILLIQETQISHITIVPSILNVLLDFLKDKNLKLPSLRQIICSGEVLALNLVNKCKAILPLCKLINLYGSTEITADVTYFDTDELLATATEVPIGKPIANIQAYILDQNLSRCPPNVLGELYIGGIGVATYQHKNGEVSLTPLIDNPYKDMSQSPYFNKLYNTGDLARFLMNGNIEYCGRSDRNFKLNGIKINPLEIEMILDNNLAIEKALVALIHEGDRDYYIAFCKTAVPNADLGQTRVELKHSLPAALIPQIFINIDEFPLNLNGKIDNEQLKSLVTHFINYNGKPTNEIETRLVTIWAEVLKHEAFGIEDDFFALGGNSLSLIVLNTKITEVFQVTIELNNYFYYRTIKDLAYYLSRYADIKQPPLIPLQPANIICNSPPLYCIHPLSGRVLPFIELAKLFSGKQTLLGITSAQLPADNPCLQSIDLLAEYYVDQIIDHSGHKDGVYLLGYSFGALVAFEMAKILTARGITVKFVGIIDAPPEVNREQPDYNQADLLININKLFAAYYQQAQHISCEDLYNLSEEEQIKYLAKRYKNIMGDNAETELLQTLSHIKTLLKTKKNYQTSGQVSNMYLYTTDDHNVLKTQWQKFSKTEVRHFSCTGSHETILQQPHVSLLADQILKSLVQCQDGMVLY